MGAAEYLDWWRYWQEEPWGAMRDNLHAGLIAAAVINARPNRRRGSTDVSAKDFLLKTERQTRQAETERSLAFLRAVGVRKVTAGA